MTRVARTGSEHPYRRPRGCPACRRPETWSPTGRGQVELTLQGEEHVARFEAGATATRAGPSGGCLAAAFFLVLDAPGPNPWSTSDATDIANSGR